VRLGLTVVLLGSLVLRWLTVGQAQVAERERFTLIAILVCAAMALSAIGLNRRVDVHRVAWLQLAMDCAAITAVTLLTNGASSVFGGLYVLSVVGSAYLVDGRGSLLVAAVYATILGLMGVWQGLEFVNLGTPERLPGLISDVSLRVMGFFLAALLAGKLTERLRAAEEQLERQASRTYALEQDLSQVVGALRSGIVLIDADGRLRSANPMALDLFPALANRPAAEVISGWEDQLEGAWETVQRGEDDRARHLLLSRSPMDDGGAVLTIEDVSRLRRMEQEVRQQERLSAVGRFAASIAHEVRNPLTALSGAVQMMEVAPDDQPLREIVLDEVARIERLITDLLESARPQAPQLQPTDLGGIIAAVVTAMGADPRIAGRVSLETQLKAVPPLQADPDQLRQVIWNLLSNAAQSMTDGGVVQVRLGVEGEGVTIMVRDEGVGIAEADLARIFDPFFTKRTGGTGLGLAVVDRIVRAHGGQIRVRSRLQQGTTFAIWLPLHPSSPTAPTEDQDAPR
jgi:two-component system sensor histidine kinase PilS (NtrC family)